jgi:hypothetical protein
MRAAPMTSKGSDLQNFLYAPICQNDEGMTLSVLSAIARQDIDPWEEAARLAQLPKHAAVQQIIDLLNTLPPRIKVCLDVAAVAARVSALLPRRSAMSLPGLSPEAATTGVATNILSFNWRFFYIYFCLMLLLNWLTAETHLMPAAVTTASRPSNHSGTPQAPSANNPVVDSVK